MTRRASRGVTLIELLVALALGVILIMLAVPSYNAWTADAEVSSAASSIADGLRTANAEAIKRNTPIEFQLSPAVGWRARLVSTGTDVTQGHFAEGARRASVVTDPPGTATVTFNPLGGVDLANADASLPIGFINVDVTGVASRPLRVLVGVTRNGIKVCDPKFAYPADPKGCP